MVEREVLLEELSHALTSFVVRTSSTSYLVQVSIQSQHQINRASCQTTCRIKCTQYKRISIESSDRQCFGRYMHDDR
jgi:hypothetical protein